jgi:hypothetical protein
LMQQKPVIRNNKISGTYMQGLVVSMYGIIQAKNIVKKLKKYSLLYKQWAIKSSYWICSKPSA